MPSNFIELSHAIEDQMPVYPGLPRPKIGAFLDHAASRETYNHQAEFHIGKLDMVCNVGTYLDSPFHRYPEGRDLSQLQLQSVAGLPAMVLASNGDWRHEVNVPFHDSQVKGHALLIQTGWDRKWGTDAYWDPGPYLSADFIHRAIRAGVKLVGVDFWNVDNVDDMSRPAHTRLLAANILIVEHLTNLAALPRAGFRFFAVPLRIVRGSSCPVRAFAEKRTYT